MKDSNYRKLIRKKMSNQRHLIKALDTIDSGQPVKAIFASLFVMIALYIKALFNVSYDSVLLNFTLYLVAIFFLMTSFHFLHKKQFFEKIEIVLFYGSRRNLFKGFILSNLLVLILFFPLLGLKSMLSFEPYFIYLYSIAYISSSSSSIFKSVYVSKELSKNDSDLFARAREIKIVASLFFILSALVYFFGGQNDPLYSSTIFCFSPFLITSFFIKKTESIYFLYRVAFFILVFFMSTTVFLHFFIAGILFLLLAKLYFFVKHDLKYPSFYINYDKSK